jgi:hypothetical protein
MATRTSFRPRPLDTGRQLPLVRLLSELDNNEALVSRSVHHSHITLDAENEEVSFKLLIIARALIVVICYGSKWGNCCDEQMIPGC